MRRSPERSDGTRGFQIENAPTAPGGGGAQLGLDSGLGDRLAADHLHGPDRRRADHDPALHAAHEAAGDQAAVIEKLRALARRGRVDEAKDELREVVEFCAIASASRKLGAKVPKGILLHGPPGTGKALLAKAVANEAEAKFFAQSASSFVEMFAGLGAARIGLFRRARKEAPAIVFIDELDAVGATRGKDISGEKDQTLNQLLVELDGFGTADNVVVIAASNLLDKLDPALLLPGRFDRQILVSRPRPQGPPGHPGRAHPRHAIELASIST